MGEIPVEVLALAIQNPEIRGFLEALVLKVIAEIMTRRSIDPHYLAYSDSAFRQWANAKTDQEKDFAITNLRNLLSQSG